MHREMCRGHRVLQKPYEVPTPWTSRGPQSKRRKGRRAKQEEAGKMFCGTHSMVADPVSLVHEALPGLPESPPPPTPKLPTGQTDIDMFFLPVPASSLPEISKFWQSQHQHHSKSSLKDQTTFNSSTNP